MSIPSPLRIASAGASGRMGRMLIEAVLNAPDCELAGKGGCCDRLAADHAGMGADGA